MLSLKFEIRYRCWWKSRSRCECQSNRCSNGADFISHSKLQYYSDQLIHFSGVIGDNEDALEDLIVSWSSSVDGDLILDTSPDADGNISDYGYLTEGQHALELRVEDTSGKITKEQLLYKSEVQTRYQLVNS